MLQVIISYVGRHNMCTLFIVFLQIIRPRLNHQFLTTLFLFYSLLGLSYKLFLVFMNHMSSTKSPFVDYFFFFLLSSRSFHFSILILSCPTNLHFVGILTPQICLKNMYILYVPLHIRAITLCKAKKIMTKYTIAKNPNS